MGLVPAEVVCPWSVRPGRGRTLGAALWALQCRLEHADQLGPVLWLLGQPSLLTAREGGRVLEETNQTEELVERVAALDIGRRS
jgi:hypothetical protein